MAIEPTSSKSGLGALAGVFWLARARFRIGLNTFRRGARWRRLIYTVVGLALAFLSLAAMATSYVTTLLIVELTEDATRADVIVTSSLSGAMVLSLMVSFTVALAALYLSKDLDLLLSSPLSRRSVFFAKLLSGLSPAHVIILAMTSVPLIGHGLAMDYSLSYYIAALAALLLLPVLPIAIGSAAVVGIVRRVSAQRVGEVVGLLVVAMTLSIAMVLGSSRQLQQAETLRALLGVAERFRNPYSPAEWLTRAVTGIGRGDLADGLSWFALIAGLGFLALIPLLLVSNNTYYRGWLKMQSAAQSSTRAGRMPWSRFDRATLLGKPSGLLRWINPATVAVLRKDFRVIPRDITNMAQVLSPLAIGVFFILQQLLYPIRFGSEGLPQRFVVPLLAMLSAGIAAGVSSMIFTRFALTAFSFEGRAYWVIKGAPVGRRELIMAKFLSAYLPYLVTSGSLLLLLELARAFSDARLLGENLIVTMVNGLDPLILAYAFGVVAVVGAGVIAISLALGSARPNLRWDTPHEMLTPDLGCLSLVLYGGYAAAAGMSLALPVAVSRFDVIRAPWLMWGVGLVLGLGLTAVAVGGGLRLASMELEAIGE